MIKLAIFFLVLSINCQNVTRKLVLFPLTESAVTIKISPIPRLPADLNPQVLPDARSVPQTIRMRVLNPDAMISKDRPVLLRPMKEAKSGSFHLKCFYRFN
ncbi:hypothetical protein BpHYR1_025608 [Brachionus plicatilis]|uniref:Uncharacterized protein n=1 Tax=Brachionus plicatilis TaxID=10195 RepID=A0A3M7SUC6_BRAPC|nr:hypothetical protein BpHYR1_025608 [Brachionus plicatilis]